MTSSESDRLIYELRARIAVLESDKRVLERERSHLAAENIDLKNQLSDLRHEEEMNRWLK